MYYSYNTHNGKVLAFISFESYNNRVYIYTQCNPDYENTMVLYNNKMETLHLIMTEKKSFLKTSLKRL